MPRRVVTLPPSETLAAAVAFAERARRSGADLLEIRTDLHEAEALSAAALSERIPLLIAERGRPAPQAWRSVAALFDGADGSIVSEHFASPLTPSDALGWWRARGVPDGVQLKHVEPLGAPREAHRLFETQALLREHFGADRVTVLATGPLALPFRAALSERNALDYCALDAGWSAAPGQRTLADAIRAIRRGPLVASAIASTPGHDDRLGILGSRISGSRSPRIHPPPFERIDLPEDADVAELLRALLPLYRGLAVTAPFKRQVARQVAPELDAVNTLVRRGQSWTAANTDVDGARAVLEALDTNAPIALGNGGATVALRAASPAVRVIARAEVRGELGGTLIWTWPAHVQPPALLRFRPGTTVGVIAYGLPARQIAQQIRARGGTPRMLGPRWFIAQARAQQALWRTAS